MVVAVFALPLPLDRVKHVSVVGPEDRVIEDVLILLDVDLSEPVLVQLNHESKAITWRTKVE